MANEITITTTIRWVRFGATLQASNTVTKSQTGTAALTNVQVIGTTSEAIVLGDVTDPAWLYLKNTDTTNDVYISTINPAAEADAHTTLGPGDATILTTGIAAWYAKANVAPVNLVVLAFQR